MTQTIYDIQDIARLTGTFTDISSNYIDPTTVTCFVETPDNNVQSFTYSSGSVVKQSTGIYYYDFTITMSGIHTYRFEGTGVCQAGAETAFTVRPSAIITG